MNISGFTKHGFWSFYALSWVIILALVLALELLPQDFWSYVGEAMQTLGVSDLNVWTIIRLASIHPVILVIFVYALAPTLAAGYLLYRSRDRAGWRDWGSRLNPLRGMSAGQAARGYGMLFAIYLVTVLAFTGLATALTEAGNPAPEMPTAKTLAETTLKAVLIDEGALLEEMGWRGFAYPMLLTRMGPSHASLLLGSLWGLWHIPAQLGSPFYSADLAYLKFIGTFVIYSIALTVFCAYFMNIMGGSVWPAILVHGFGNYSSIPLAGLWWGVQAGFLLKTLILIAVAIVLVIATRGRLGLKQEA